MRIAFIADPFSCFDKIYDSTWSLMQAAWVAGDRVFYADASSLKLENNTAKAQLIELDQHFFDHQFVSEASVIELPEQAYAQASIDLDTMDMVFMRKDPPVDINYVNACHVLAYCKKALVLNNPNSLIKFNEKLATMLFPELVPDSIVTRTVADIKEFLSKHGKIVVKPLDLMGGKGVFLLDSKASVDKGLQINDVNFSDGVLGNFMIVQEYLPEVKTEGDRRLILANGKFIGAVLRIPAENDFRANLSSGGSFVAYDPDDNDLKLCKRMESFLVDNGIYFAAIDLIGNKLTEINITCPSAIPMVNISRNLTPAEGIEHALLEELKQT